MWESESGLTGLVFCQPHRQQVISEPPALCQGAMEGAGSWRMLVVLKCTGQQEGWDAHIWVCGSDLGSSGARK